MLRSDKERKKKDQPFEHHQVLSPPKERKTEESIGHLIIPEGKMTTPRQGKRYAWGVRIKPQQQS